MKINKLSFITPIEILTDKKLILEKSYSHKYQITDEINISIASDIASRETQQDSIAVTENGGYTLLLVSDGMGGMLNGEIASYTTARIIKKWIDTEDKEALKTVTTKTLEDALNALMYLISTQIPISSGATLNMSLIGPTETLIANVGDSRTYTIKDGKINLRTTDDSIVFNKYRPKTGIDRDILRFHKQNNIITNSISKNTFPIIKVTSIKNTDYDILCHLTDGITDYLPEVQILKYASQNNPAQTLVYNSINGLPIKNDMEDEQFRKCIYPAEDNATAIVYTKKKLKSN